MRLKFLTGILCILLLGIGFTADATDIKNEDASGNHIIVYYFHGNFRCATCHGIENYTKEAIDNNFQKELKNGQLEFKAINTEKPQNRHYMKDYNLYTKSVVLSLVKNGKEVKFKNLEKVWECVRDKKRFESYVREETAAYLKELD